MDNITHSLTGLALARTGLNRWSPCGTALLLISANIPDIDIVAATRGGLAYLENHRGYTHSLIGVPVMVLLSVLLVALMFRRKLPWLRAFSLCCIGVASHLLLDWTNSYGIRPFLPFSSRWFHLDLNGLYDWSILTVLLFAAMWPLFARLVSSEIGDRRPQGRGVAFAALLFFLLFDLTRGVLHGWALAKLNARLYDDAPPTQAAALPDSLNPLRWRGVVETVRGFELFDMSAVGELDTNTATIFYKAEESTALLAAKNTEPFRFFSYFARFPLWSVQHIDTGASRGSRIELTDLRFSTPDRGGFHCVADVDNRNRVLLSTFTFTAAANQDRGKDSAEHTDQP